MFGSVEIALGTTSCRFEPGISDDPRRGTSPQSRAVHAPDFFQMVKHSSLAFRRYIAVFSPLSSFRGSIDAGYQVLYSSPSSIFLF